MKKEKMVYLYLDNEGIYNILHSIYLGNDGLVKLYTSAKDFTTVEEKYFCYTNVSYRTESEAIRLSSMIDDIVDEWLKEQEDE